jgi:hypothetical protein
MPKQLTNLDIQFISLVEKGANKRSFILKDKDGFAIDVPIVKVDDEKGIAYGIVYAPGDLDAQGDFAKAIDIEKAAHNFVASGRSANIDVQHNFEKSGAQVVESWIVKDQDIFEDVGAWAVGVKLTDELVKAAKDGKLNAFSMAGTATRIETDAVGKTVIEKAIESVNEQIEKFGKLFKKETSKEVKKAADGDAFNVALAELLVLQGEAIANIVEQVEKSRTETIEKLEELKKHRGSGSGSQQNHGQDGESGEDEVRIFTS